MQTVDIYLYTSSNAPMVADGEYKYLLTCPVCQPVEGSGKIGRTTGIRLAMVCAVEALEHMRKPAVVTVHTSCRCLITNRQYLPAWEKNGWIRTNGKQVKNADLWQRLRLLETGHAIRYQYEPKERNSK